MKDLSKKLPVLVLGASGFIGKSVTEYLNNKKYELITPSSQECDLLSVKQVRQYFEGITTPVQIVFCAGILGRRENSFSSLLKNIQMIQSLADMAPSLSIRSVVHLSSTDVYGSPTGIITENTIISPRSYYGLSKFSGEMIFNMESFFSIPVTILRIPGIYGAGDHQKSIVGLFLDQLANNGVVNINGDGSALRDYVQVNDVCRLVEHFLCSPYQGRVNVATGQSITIKDLVSILGKALGVSPKINFKENGGKAASQRLVFDITRLKGIVPAFQFTDIHTGIDDYVKCLAKN